MKKPDDSKYSLFHSPTKTWVYFKKNILMLVAFPAYATAEHDPNKLYEKLYHSTFNQDPDYGKTHLLEFQLKEIFE